MKIKKLGKNQSGIAAIEFAIILPVLLLILFGVVDYGLYFYKEQIIERSISNITNSIQLNPADTSLKSIALNSGLGVVNFKKSPNYYCANSYITYAEAKAGSCTSGQFTTTPPAALPENDPYYVAIATSVVSTPVAAFMAPIMPDSIKSRTVFKVNTVSTAAVENTTVKNCNAANERLGTDAKGNLICRTIKITISPAVLGGGGKKYICPANSVMCGFDCTGDCGTDHMSAYCCSLGLQ